MVAEVMINLGTIAAGIFGGFLIGLMFGTKHGIKYGVRRFIDDSMSAGALDIDRMEKWADEQSEHETTKSSD